MLKLKLKRAFQVSLFVLISLTCLANVTVSGNLRTILGSSSVPKKGFVRFTLQNYSGITPHTDTFPIVQLSSDAYADSITGAISTTLIGNDEILPSGTYYTLEFYSNGQFQSAINCVINTPSFNLNLSTNCTLPPSSSGGTGGNSSGSDDTTDAYIDANHFTTLQGSVNAVSDAGGDLFLPVKTYSPAFTGSAVLLKPKMQLYGQGRGSKLTHNSIANVLQYQNHGEGFDLHDFTIAGTNGRTQDCIWVRNDKNYPASGFTWQNLTIWGCNNDVHLTAYDPDHTAAGNVYGFTFLHPHWTTSDSNSLLIDGQVGIPGINVFGGSIEGGGVSNIHFTSLPDAASWSSVIHHINAHGVILQGATGPAIWVDKSIVGGSVIGSYFEQVTTSPALRVSRSGTTDKGGFVAGFLWAANTAGSSPTITPNYWFELNDNGTGAANTYVAIANRYLNCGIAAYNVSNTNGALVGFGDSVVGNCTRHYDWDNAGVYADFFAWDVKNHTFTASSDGVFFDHPKIGIGVKGNAVQAMLHVAPQRQPDAVSGNGAAATDALKVVGGKGGNTTGTSGQNGGKGANITLQSGDGGNAPSGAKNGDAGDIVAVLGSSGIGAGSAGSAGKFVIRNKGIDLLTVTADGNVQAATFNGTTPGFQPWGGFGYSQNYFEYSNDFTNAYWTKGVNVTAVTANYSTAPDGTNTALRVQTGSSGDPSLTGKTATFSGNATGTYTASVYMQANTGSPTIALYLSTDTFSEGAEGFCKLNTAKPSLCSVTYTFTGTRPILMFSVLSNNQVLNNNLDISVWQANLCYSASPCLVTPTTTTPTATQNAVAPAGGFFATSGLSATKTVKGSDGNNCNLVFTSGLLTSTTCP